MHISVCASLSRTSLLGGGDGRQRAAYPGRSASRLGSKSSPARAPSSAFRAYAAVDELKVFPEVDVWDPNQAMREGSHERSLFIRQALKQETGQPSITSVLEPLEPLERSDATLDAIVVGCGPAGLALAAELGKRGVSVALVGHDVPFVNTYGVWEDEFLELNLTHTLDKVWRSSSCYFKEGKETKVSRAYGRVNKKLLRDELLGRCKKHGVRYYNGTVVGVEVGAVDSSEGGGYAKTMVTLRDGAAFAAKMVTLASGGAAGRFLKYEDDAPSTAAQTAYGIEADVTGYVENGKFDKDAMLFMDFRRHHTGLYPGTASKQVDGEHPNGGEGQWETGNEAPSFLYAMPESDGKRVFLEETCLVAKPALPFSVLKRRLYRRCEALGITIDKVHEEEWSYIPTGGPLPARTQGITAFGSAANLVHPATGYSIVRSLRAAPGMADAIVKGIKEQPNAVAAAEVAWEALWSMEDRRQASFHVFGMELLCQLDVKETTDFFSTFFALPKKQWEGFLASKLSSVDLLGFALYTFAIAPLNIKVALVNHLATHPAGAYFIRTYLKSLDTGDAE
jgi:lycopene epsilon-cyclase